MAPPTKPIEAKRRLGTLRKDRTPKGPLTIIAPASRSLEPPPMVGDVGAAEWRHVLQACAWIAPSDLTVLRLYCLALDRHSALLALLAQEGTVLYTDKGYAYLNPAQGALATTEAQITKWQSLLGLTASDRSRMGVAEVKARTKLEELRDRREIRAGPRAG
jgi:P27 family predicted phage terminase small subunit